MNSIDPTCVAVIGLGYVGLPLATALAQHLPTIGFDVNPKRIQALRDGADWNGELSADTLSAPHLLLTDDPSRLREAAFLIVAVPTPTDRAKRPDLGPLMEASRLVGRHLRPGPSVRISNHLTPHHGNLSDRRKAPARLTRIVERGTTCLITVHGA